MTWRGEAFSDADAQITTVFKTYQVDFVKIKNLCSVKDCLVGEKESHRLEGNTCKLQITYPARDLGLKGNPQTPQQGN